MTNSNLPINAPIELRFEDITLTCPIEAGHRMIPVKRVCEIVDVDYKTQDNWLKQDPFYSQLYRLIPTTGADNKTYEMSCLGFLAMFGWLNSLGEKNRKPGSVERQKIFMAWIFERHMEMYKTIEVWQQENQYEVELIQQLDSLVNLQENAQSELKRIQQEIKKTKSSLEDVRTNRFTGQTSLPFTTE